jgi:hypothetical protein
VVHEELLRCITILENLERLGTARVLPQEARDIDALAEEGYAPAASPRA